MFTYREGRLPNAMEIGGPVLECEWIREISKRDLYDCYKAVTPRNALSQTAFWARMKEILPGIQDNMDGKAIEHKIRLYENGKKIRRNQVYVILPGLEDARREFQATTGFGFNCAASVIHHGENSSSETNNLASSSSYSEGSSQEQGGDINNTAQGESINPYDYFDEKTLRELEIIMQYGFGDCGTSLNDGMATDTLDKIDDIKDASIMNVLNNNDDEEMIMDLPKDMVLDENENTHRGEKRKTPISSQEENIIKKEEPARKKKKISLRLGGNTNGCIKQEDPMCEHDKKKKKISSVRKKDDTNKVTTPPRSESAMKLDMLSKELGGSASSSQDTQMMKDQHCKVTCLICEAPLDLITDETVNFCKLHGG